MLIEVLGPVRLSTDDGVPVEVAERKLRLLLAALVAAEGAPVSADALIDRLWEQNPPAHPRNVLRAKLSHLRTILDTAQPGARDALERTPAGYRLAVEDSSVDAARFKAAVGHARHREAPAQKAEALHEALALWRGEPYGDMGDETWLAPVVADLTQVRGDAVELLVETLVEVGEPHQAIDHGTRALGAFPTRERLVGALMLALVQVGRQHEALEAFESLRHRLADELGVDPGPHVRELHTRILRQDPAVGIATVPATGSGAPARTNLPAETEPLIGRRADAALLDGLLAESRLVTVTGIGGVGKTRLALQCARARLLEFERGVWFIDLSALTPTEGDQQPASGERVAFATAAAMGLPDRAASSDALARVAEAVGTRSILLVLDNCEHVVAEAAVFVAELLRRASGARVLATSREPLGLPEERRSEVGTLSTSSRQDDRPGEAVEFFAARARAADPTFTLDDDNTPTVTELCRRLDGLPLALELAAARVRGLAVGDLLERLSDRLNILRRPGHGAPRRQQTLRGMIDWSWSLLNERERSVLRRLAVHPGAIGLEAAEAICGDDHERGERARPQASEVTDVVIGLVDRSLVTVESTPTGARYGLLESIATYAGEKLDEADEREAVADRHVDYYVDLVRRADRGLRGSHQRHWMARMEAEGIHVRHAFDRAVSAQDGKRAVALVLGTFWSSWMSGRQAHLRRDLDRAVGLPGPRDDSHASATTLAVALAFGAGDDDIPQMDAALALFSDDALARARVQWFAGMAHLSSNRPHEGERLIDDAIAVLLQHGQDWDAAVATCQRDWVVVMSYGESPRGLPDGRSPEEVLRAVGDAGYGMTHVHGVEYCVAEVTGHIEHAAAAAERALEISLDTGFWSDASYWMIVGAISALRSGDLHWARSRLDDGRAMAQDIAYRHGLNFADFAESMIARYEGDVDRARILLDPWLTHGDTTVPDPAAQLEDGHLAVQEERLDHAQRVLEELHPAVVETARPHWTARLLELGAALRASRGQHAAAAGLLGTAHALRGEAEAHPSIPERNDIDRIRSVVEAHLSADEVARSISSGRDADPGTQLAAASA